MREAGAPSRAVGERNLDLLKEDRESFPEDMMNELASEGYVESNKGVTEGKVLKKKGTAWAKVCGGQERRTVCMWHRKEANEMRQKTGGGGGGDQGK